MNFEITDEQYTKLLNYALQMSKNNSNIWNSLDFDTRRNLILSFLDKA